MTKQEALDLIDKHKNGLINPMVLLAWTWLRVIILNISDEEWEKAANKAVGTLSR